MSASPERIVGRERTVMVVVAVIVLAAIAAGVWAASGRGAQPVAETAAVSPSVQPSPATLAALAEPTPSATPSAPPSPTPSPSATTPAKKAETTSGDEASTSGSRGSASADASAGASGGSGSSSGTSTPSASKTRKPSPTPTPTKTAQASAVPSAAHLVVSGKVDKKTYFTVADLKKMRTVSADFFSRGKEPPESTTAFVGVRLTDILKKAGLKASAERVTILAADDYSASFSLRQVQASYIDETHPGVSLPMIIAYSEDGAAYTGDHPFRLAMGQSVEGDYNRQYWVRLVVSITVL